VQIKGTFKVFGVPQLDARTVVAKDCVVQLFCDIHKEFTATIVGLPAVPV
jgi:hypothetical protein